MNTWNILSFLSMIFTALAVSGQQLPAEKVDELPCFQGCFEQPAGSAAKQTCCRRRLLAYLKENLRYPEEAQAQGIEGTVYVRFVVEADGRVAQVTLLNDIGGGCGEEALRVVRQMPPWEPARFEGRAVACALDLPVHFNLKKPDPAENFHLLWGKAPAATLTRKELKALLEAPPAVRDLQGTACPITQLEVLVERKNRTLRVAGPPDWNREMKRLALRARPHNRLTLRAYIQADGRILPVERTWALKR